MVLQPGFENCVLLGYRVLKGNLGGTASNASGWCIRVVRYRQARDPTVPSYVWDAPVRKLPLAQQHCGKLCLALVGACPMREWSIVLF